MVEEWCMLLQYDQGIGFDFRAWRILGVGHAPHPLEVLNL